MNYLLNIYNSGLIAETHIIASEENAVELFNAYVDTIENTFERATCTYSCTPTQEETTQTNNKKTKNK